ncbi:MAG: exodeoxyribonuclease I [Agarilytica sp.]
MQSFYWHDYETWGATPAVDRASQFAGVRTDMDLNIIDDPLVIYCQPPEDIWPHPEACLVTGILPQEAKAKGLLEKDFIEKIHRELSCANTCSVGYNTLRFDDEVTRYTLYRNFYEPYAREWQNGNSRWDIIDMMRLVYALRPEGIEWPIVDDVVSFKLENLTVANGVSHASAHDAYSDVEATIAMAKLVKTRKPDLYDFVFKNRDKKLLASMIDIQNCKPLLHVSSMFSAARGCTSIIVPLAMHPKNKNAVIAYDLSVDPSPMADMTAEDIRERVFVKQDELPEGVERLPVKLIHLNKCPILATVKLLQDPVAKRLGIDKAQYEAHWQIIRQMNTGPNFSLGNTLVEMYQLDEFDGASDPEMQLYDGFIGGRDKGLMQDIHQLSESQLLSRNFVFEDERLNQMLPRYLARNYPAVLEEGHMREWQEFVANRLAYGDERILSYAELKQGIMSLKHDLVGDAAKIELLDKLETYADEHFAKYQHLVV